MCLCVCVVSVKLEQFHLAIVDVACNIFLATYGHRDTVAPSKSRMDEKI